MNNNYKDRIWIGIDPGLSGAVAVITEKPEICSLQDTPVIPIKKGKIHRTFYLPAAMATLLNNAAACGHLCGITLEDVFAMPGQGVTSMFSIGLGKGLWMGLAAALQQRLELVNANIWKREYGLLHQDKAASVARALELFPSAAGLLKRKCDHNRAEALLLAEYGRRRTTGGLKPSTASN